MLAPKPMSRVLIVASRDQAEPIIGELYREHLFHIEDYVDQGREGYEGFKIGTPLPGQRKHRRSLSRSGQSRTCSLSAAKISTRNRN